MSVKKLLWISKKKVKEIVWKTFLYIILLTGAFLFLIPLVWIATTSLKEVSRVFVFPPEWIPRPVMWENYRDALTIMPFFLFLRNSGIITGSCIVGFIISSSLCAYGFARLRFPGRTILFVLVLSTMMMPWVVTFVPLYIMFSKIRWIDTYKPFIVPAFLSAGYGGGFFIFLLRQFFLTIPVEMEEAARIDGCSTFGIYCRIVLPLSKPVLGIVAIFSFIWVWNDFIGPLLYLKSVNKFTAALGLSFFYSMYQVWWHHLAAATVVVVAPCIILFIFAQRYFIQGIVITGLKG
ncbi:MAG: carbohydrate ABC transporter permease [bacterium]